MTLEEARRELGVSGRASALAVRKAFKRLALRRHPDHNKDDPRAAERFRQLCVAYEILSGARAPDPSFDTQQDDRDRIPTWGRRREPERPDPLPSTWSTGEPIYYPTPAEIAALDLPRTGGSRRTAWKILIGIVALMGLLAFIEAMSGRPPARLDDYREMMRKGLWKRW